MSKNHFLISLVLFSLSCTLFEKEEEEKEDTLQGIVINPGDDIQSIVDTNPEGTTFILKAGVHRFREIWPKDGNTFIGENGAIMNGSRLLTEFETDGGLYYAANQTQGDWYGGSDICQEGWERCNHPEDLYFDNVPLRHVTSLADVAPGKWFFDYDADRIYFADDPTGHTVETSVTYLSLIHISEPTRPY